MTAGRGRCRCSLNWCHICGRCLKKPNPAASTSSPTTEAVQQTCVPNCNASSRRLGLTPWPKLFQNLRSTRETELAEDYPLHVVVAWIGNSQPVAAKHYLQVTDDHFAQAVQNPVQQASRTELHGVAR